MRAAAELIERPTDAVVLTVWETLATQLARTGAFVAGSAIAGVDLDAEEESYARSVAEDGALRASEHEYETSAMTRESFDGVAHCIVEAADELSARLIVCGQRGRGPIRTALLGSVSHALVSHTRHPVLIVPHSSVGDT